MFQATRNTVIKYGAVLTPMLFAGAAFADPVASIAEAQDAILAIVAAAGAAFIAVALAGVGWTVGAKFIKRIGGKA
jgi:hypothetical protein